MREVMTVKKLSKLEQQDNIIEGYFKGYSYNSLEGSGTS